MPNQQRIRSDERSDFSQNSAAELLGWHGQATSLAVVELQALASELLSQHAVLFSQVADDVLLMSVDPPASAIWMNRNGSSKGRIERRLARKSA